MPMLSTDVRRWDFKYDFINIQWGLGATWDNHLAMFSPGNSCVNCLFFRDLWYWNVCISRLNLLRKSHGWIPDADKIDMLNRANAGGWAQDAGIAGEAGDCSKVDRYYVLGTLGTGHTHDICCWQCVCCAERWKLTCCWGNFDCSGDFARFLAFSW